jgi:hypothetical protein
MPAVFREPSNYPITLPITGQFLALLAPATGPIPLGNGRVALTSNESARHHVARSCL